MYGWRARIGVMIPSANTTVENEYIRMAPEGVSVHTSRMYMIDTNAENLKKMTEQVDRCTHELSTAKCDTIVFGCTSGSFVGGVSWNSDLEQKMEKIAGVPCLTTSTALRRALKLYGKKKLSIVTPYIAELNVLEKSFFEAVGYEVLDIKGLDIEDNATMGMQPHTASYRLAKQIPKETELLIISCTDFRSIENLSALEEDLGLPVISSNQASFWAALRAAGVNEKLTGYGSLFSY